MNAQDILKYGNSFLMEKLDGLPEADWHIPEVCGVWSAKDVVAHLATFEGLLVEILYDLLGQDQPRPLMESIGQRGPMEFNDYEVDQRKKLAVHEVLNEYHNAHAEALVLIERIPVAKRRELGALPWYGAEYDLEDYLVYSFYGHKREHGAEIAAFRDRLKRGN